jgi:alpha-tubulin suppressor-like RCC1 family protein
MSSTRAQLVAPIGNVDANGGIIVSGVTTAGTFGGNFSGTATGLTGTPNLNVGVITATSFVGDGSNLTGIAATPFNGQNVTSVAGITTIDLSSGNVIYFTHNTDTTVAFANTTTTQSLTFIRTKDDTSTARSITWSASVVWSGGATPTLNNNPRSTDAQQFNLLTRDSGETWYGHQEVNVDPQTTAFFSWAYNGTGQLGQNTTTNVSSPIQIPGTSWSTIHGGRRYSLAKKTDGTLWSWGQNNTGQLGQNDVTNRSSPVQIPGTTWSSISGGFQNTLATKTDGTLWSWGYNNSGRLGQNTTTYFSSPVQIPGTSWSAIDAGGNLSLATKTDGTLWSWGFGGNGLLGQNDTIRYSSPVQIPGTSWNKISAGSYHSLATKIDGTLWSWGGNTYGGLGQNNTTQFSSPVQIPGTSWNSIFLGINGHHSLATKTDNTLWSWGRNHKGQLGQNTTTDISSPVQIPGTTWSSITSGYSHSLATKTDSTLWAWGRGSYGNLGQNTTTDVSSPVQIPGTTWSSISSGQIHLLATQLQ